MNQEVATIPPYEDGILSARRAYPFQWPMPDRAEVLPVAGLLTRNADLDLRRAELVWAPRTVQ